MREMRDRWERGLVRHLRLDPDCPPGEVSAVRVERNGGLEVPGGSEDVAYTLVVHPKHEARVEEFRARLERSDGIGGVFSPPRDL